MARSDFRFHHPMRVRYAECDMQGVVFNSRYLEYLDVGISEYWRTVGMFAGDTKGLEFHVARNLCDYRRPLVMDEEFDICLTMARIGRSSMTTRWEIHPRGGEEICALGETVNVHVAEVRGAPAPVPDAVVRMFETYEGRALRAERKAA
ncbi:MAG: thioesterase family protein [Pseudomonadota bacterium]